MKDIIVALIFMWLFGTLLVYCFITENSTTPRINQDSVYQHRADSMVNAIRERSKHE